MDQTLSSSKTLKLTVNYRPISLNRMLRWHWAKRAKEKLKFADALESSIRAALSDPRTPTIWLGQLRSALTCLEQSGCFRMTLPTTSNSLGDNKKSQLSVMK